MITSRKLVSVFWDKWRPPAETGDRWWLHRSQRGRLNQPTSPRPDALPVFLSGCEEAYSDKPCLFFMWAVLIASLAARVSRCFDCSGEQRGRIPEREARTPSVNSSGRQSCSNKDELTTRMLRRKSLNPIYLNDWLIRKLPVKMLVFKLLPSADIALDKQSIQIGVLV